MKGVHAVIVLHGLDQDLEDGKERECRDQHADRHDGARDKRVPLEISATGKSQRKDHRKGAGDKARADADAVLLGRKRAEPLREGVEVPARGDDRDALHKETGKTRGADRDHAVGASPAIESGCQQRAADDQQRSKRQEPRSSVPERLHYRRRVVVTGPITEPCHTQHRVLQRVPRQ